jgi:hypothetical protein
VVTAASHGTRDVVVMGFDRSDDGIVGTNLSRVLGICHRLAALCCPVSGEALGPAVRSFKE